MNNNDLYIKLKNRLQSKQSHPRFTHSVSVGEWAAKLGGIHGWAPERARLAGLLHDTSKEWSPKKLKRYVKKYKLDVPDFDFIIETSPNMLHAYVGSDFVRRKKWITNKKDLKAIASHTLGSKKMGLEEKILFIADFSAPGRTYASAETIRKIAVKDLQAALRETMACKMAENLRKSKSIHPMAVVAWNHVACGVKK